MQRRLLPPSHRILFLLRPLTRHSTAASRFGAARPFTQNSQLLLIGPGAPRPQLPFLSPVAQRSGPKGGQLRLQAGQWHLSRLVTTKTKQTLKEGLRLGTIYFVVFWTTVLLVCVIVFGVQHEQLERRYPTPSEWTYFSRWHFRYARSQEEDNEDSPTMPDVSASGSIYINLLKRLESPEIDGKDLDVQGDGGILVAGVGSTGFDISKKSYPWRRSYFLVLMSCARAAEQREGWVRDHTRRLNFPPEYVVGPSNPHPKPVPIGSEEGPREENCSPAFPAPESFYLKILTTKGFTTRERLDAAVAYADWLDFKGLPGSADEMHKWGIDIATAPFDLPSGSIIDAKTGVLVNNAPTSYVTPNVLLATASLGMHHARNSEFSRALPILVSALRARRNSAPFLEDTQLASTEPSPQTDVIDSLRALLSPPAYPSPPPSGNEPAHRTASSICSEAGLMSNIGEVLFASSRHNDGLAWTRDAVDIAETQFRELVPENDTASRSSADADTDQEGDGPALARCTECLDAAMDNWRTMVLQLAQLEEMQLEQRKARQHEIAHQQLPQTRTPSPWSWFWPTGNEAADLGTGGSSGVPNHDEIRIKGRWESELEVIDKRSARVEELLYKEKKRKEKERMSVWQKLIDG